MSSISIRPSPKEREYLARIASENKLKKGNSETLSPGKAMHELLRWCHSNQVDINNINKNISNGFSPELAKMIEHMHIAIPNLMYLARLQTMLMSEGIPDEKIMQIRRQTLDYLNRTCGDFQNAQYNYVRFTMNDMQLKITQADKDNTLWKLPSV